MSAQKPSIGRIVHYQLAQHDADAISALEVRHNAAFEGDVYPAMIVRTFGGGDVQLQVFIDGAGTYWATSRNEGEVSGTWRWPPRV